MLLTEAQLQEIRQIIADHHTAFVVNTISPDSVPPEALQRLSDMGLIKQQATSIEDAYLYGQVLAALDSPSTKNMSYAEFKNYLKKNPVPLGEVERQAIKMAQMKAAQYAVGLGNTISNATGEVLIEADADLRARMRDEIQTQTALNIARRETVKQLKSRLGWATNDWARDWDRIAVTEKHNAMQRGHADRILRLHGGEARVFKRIQPNACKHCVRLHIGPDGQPRIFKLSTLEDNGTNFGKKADDWQAVVGSTHPHCQCQLVHVPDGWGFNEEGQLVPGGKYGVQYDSEEDIELAVQAEDDLQKAFKLHGHTQFQGIPIAIENDIGSVRKWTDALGNQGETVMRVAYGYMKRTTGADEDEIDVFLGPDPNATHAYVIHQQDPFTGKYDEDKVMLGCSNEAVAKLLYRDHFNRPDFYVTMTPMPMDHFKRWAASSEKHTGEMMKKSGPALVIPLEKGGVTPIGGVTEGGYRVSQDSKGKRVYTKEDIFAPKVTAAAVKQIQKDMRVLAKLYRAIRVPETFADTQDPEKVAAFNKDFEEARAAFNKFSNTLQVWSQRHLGVLPDAGTSTAGEGDDYVMQTLREASFRLTDDLYKLFAESYDPTIDAHTPSATAVDRAKKSVLKSYQAKVRDFLKAADRFIADRGGEIDTTPQRRFHTGGVQFVVHGEAMDESGEQRTTKFLREVHRAISRLKDLGLEGAIRGLTVHLHNEKPATVAHYVDEGDHPSTLVGGWYAHTKDSLRLFPLGWEESNQESLIHEIGHRVYYRMLGNRGRAEWERTMEAGRIPITPAHIDEFVDKFASKHTYTLAGTGEVWDWEKVQAAAAADTSELSGVFVHLSKHMPMSARTPEALRKKMKELLEPGETANREYVSGYAETNPAELFAEAFMTYVNKGPAAVPPWTREQLRQALRAADVQLRKSFAEESTDRLAFTIPLEEDKLEKFLGFKTKPVGPYIGKRGGKWADPEHTIPWREGVPEFKAENASRKQMVEAAHKAAAAGADPASMKFVGAGMEGIIFTDKSGKAFKVHRPRPGSKKSLDKEAAALEGLQGTPAGEHLPKFHSFDKEHQVIVRDHVEGSKVKRMDDPGVREAWEAIAKETEKLGLGVPEFSETAFIQTESGPVMIDVGDLRERGSSIMHKHRPIHVIDLIKAELKTVRGTSNTTFATNAMRTAANRNPGLGTTPNFLFNVPDRTPPQTAEDMKPTAREVLEEGQSDRDILSRDPDVYTFQEPWDWPSRSVLLEDEVTQDLIDVSRPEALPDDDTDERRKYMETLASRDAYEGFKPIYVIQEKGKTRGVKRTPVRPKRTPVKA